MKEKLVSVVIPSYNRAHLLSKTIPTYIQEDVGEVIIVDDCSLDDTKEVVSRLQNKYPEIKYFRMLKNSKQTAAKNEGKKHAKYPYIYFGDDDSFILPGTIHRLLETMDIYSADVVGAKALYLNNKQEYTHLNKFVFDNSRPITSIEYELNIKRMFFINFNFDVDTPIRVPFCHACALVKTVVGQVKSKFVCKFLQALKSLGCSHVNLADCHSLQLGRDITFHHFFVALVRKDSLACLSLFVQLHQR